METVNGKTFTSPSQATFEKQQPAQQPQTPAPSASQQVRVEKTITKGQAEKLAEELSNEKTVATDPKSVLANIYSHVKGKK